MSTEGDRDYDRWLSQLTLEEIDKHMRDLGVEKVEIKRLSPRQDNSKNQIYWRGSLSASPLPLGKFHEHQSSSRRTSALRYRASLSFSWLTPQGSNPAPHAQLIHYPQYPESRLGGLLKGAPMAPRSLLATRESSRPGRMLLLGVAGLHVYGLALPPEAPAARQLETLLGKNTFILRALSKQAEVITPERMLAELSGVLDLALTAPCTISGSAIVPSTARNSAGTTLETVMGVRPNSRDEPDFHGWELKAHRDSRITLMTPAPTLGAVVDRPAVDFMRRFGRLNEGGTRWDFTGAHTALHVPGGKSTTRMVLEGDEVRLIHKKTDEVAMGWRIPDLLDHWWKKHSLAAYVRYAKTANSKYVFGPYVHLCQGIDFPWYWEALRNGTIAIDPACNLTEGKAYFNKARYQFRCGITNLPSLYPNVSAHDLRHVEPSRRFANANLAQERLSIPDWVTQSA